MGRPLKQRDLYKDNKLWCNGCSKYLELDMFFLLSKGNKYRNNRETHCKICRSIQAKERRLTLHKNSLNKLLQERIGSINDRCKKKGLKSEITKDYLYELLVKQNFKCALSGIEMTHIIGESRTITNISVDRIDSTIGYTKDNIQLVCMVVNQMKSDLTKEELLYWCKEIIKQNES